MTAPTSSPDATGHADVSDVSELPARFNEAALEIAARELERIGAGGDPRALVTAWYRITAASLREALEAHADMRERLLCQIAELRGQLGRALPGERGVRTPHPSDFKADLRPMACQSPAPEPQRPATAPTDHGPPVDHSPTPEALQ